MIIYVATNLKGLLQVIQPSFSLEWLIVPIKGWYLVVLSYKQLVAPSTLLAKVAIVGTTAEIAMQTTARIVVTA